MLQTTAQSWWLYALRGVAAIIFGVLAFTSPGATILALILVFGIYALIEGVRRLSLHSKCVKSSNVGGLSC